MIAAAIALDQPFNIDAQGRIGFTSDPNEQLRNRVRMVIGTALHERVMRPTYGTPLAELLFEAGDELTTSIITSDIEKALRDWEPGVIVQSVTADHLADHDGLISVDVVYSAVNSPLQTLSLPINVATIYRGGLVQEERSG